MSEEFPDIDYDLVFSVPDDEDFPSGSQAAESNGHLTPEELAQRTSLVTRSRQARTESAPAVEPTAPHVPVREAFPEAGTEYLGGESDGLVYRSVFLGKTGQAVYEMICAFLRDEGYADIPVPADFAELSKFRIPVRNKQILLFEDNGYVHNPVKILFPKTGKSARKLILELYNESAPGHLLRFHGKGE